MCLVDGSHSLTLGKIKTSQSKWEKIRESTSAHLIEIYQAFTIYMSITYSMDMSLNKLWETVKDTEDWRAAAHGVTKSQTGLSNWTTITSLYHLPRKTQTTGFPVQLLLLLSHFSRVWLCATPRRKPIRLPHPRDSLGKNTGVGCHFLLQCMKVKSESEVTQSCPTLSDPMDRSLPGSSIHGIFQARVLEWVAIAFSAKHSWR